MSIKCPLHDTGTAEVKPDVAKSYLYLSNMSMVDTNRTSLSKPNLPKSWTGMTKLTKIVSISQANKTQVSTGTKEVYKFVCE